MNEKLQKVLARFGYGSRRNIEKIIKQRRINVNGQIANLGDRIEINNFTKISIDNKIITTSLTKKIVCRVICYYKSEGEICTSYDPYGRKNIFNKLPNINNARWINIGRLDLNTSGLLLFTNDGELANRLMHPSFQIEREYTVCILGNLNKEKKRHLISGVQLKDGKAAFKKVIFQKSYGLNKWYNVIITEGRNHEVRRIWAALGIKINKLIRM